MTTTSPSTHTRHRARRWLVVIAVAAALTAPLSGPRAVDGYHLATARAATGAKWGIVVQARPGRTRQQELTRLEGLVGRRFVSARVYDNWDSPFPTAEVNSYRDTGHDLWISVKARRRDGTNLPWASIAAAQPGSALYADMVRWAQRIRDFGDTTYVIFNHEPETATNKSRGTAADYVAAWRNWVSVFRSVGVPNARFTWVATAYAFRRGAPRPAQAYYPGDAYVDDIGADGYNWLDCRSSVKNAPRSFAAIFNDFRTFGLAHSSLPLVIGEWGSAESSSDPAYKGQWITDARSTLEQPKWAQVSYVNYFHARDGASPTCLWYADTSQQSLDAFTAMGSDPYFG